MVRTYCYSFFDSLDPYRFERYFVPLFRYLDYGEENWKAKTKSLLDKIET